MPTAHLSYICPGDGGHSDEVRKERAKRSGARPPLRRPDFTKYTFPRHSRHPLCPSLGWYLNFVLLKDCVLSDFPYSCKGDVTKNRELRRELGGYPLHVVND